MKISFNLIFTTQMLILPILITAKAPVHKGKVVYYLEYIGDFTALKPSMHPLTGRVFIRDANTITISNFTYPGNGPDAFFWAGQLGVGDQMPNESAIPGVPLPYPQSKDQKLLGYYDESIKKLGKFEKDKKDIILKLPSGVTSDKLAFLSVWCRKFKVDFGHVKFNQVLSRA